MLGRSESEGVEPRNNLLQMADLFNFREGRNALSGMVSPACRAGV